MQCGEALTRILAQLATGCYLLRVLLDVWGFASPRMARWNRRIWTVGCFALWLHIAAAFHFFHDWSHSGAVRQTAEQTKELIGWAFGGGVYINYAFAAIWLGDVIVWWRQDLEDDRKSSRRFWIIHAIVAFMMLNATVIFGPPYWPYIGILFVGLLVVVWAIQRRSRDSN